MAVCVGYNQNLGPYQEWVSQLLLCEGEAIAVKRVNIDCVDRRG